MIDLFYGINYYITSVVNSGAVLNLFLYYFPFVLILEMPFYAFTLTYSIRGWLVLQEEKKINTRYTPLVTIVVMAYSESYDELEVTFNSINEQIYDGVIEILVIVDNAPANQKTDKAAKALAKKLNKGIERQFKVISKTARGGHANSMNLGLKLAKGEVTIVMDGDTSMDNTTIAHTAKHFKDPNVIAVSGAVRVRNRRDSIITRMQAIEYMLSIQLGRFGLTQLDVTNNISGAFGIFRTRFLRQVGGWLNGTAEDLDLMLRVHTYLTRYPWLRVVHEPYSIAWTVAPVRLRDLLKQRVRWDGDLFYIYVTRHWRFFSTKLVSFKKLFFIVWYGLYFQLILPFVIVIYMSLILMQYPMYAVLGMILMIYFYYLSLTFFMFALFLLLVSERPKDDRWYLGWLFILPLYNLMMRIFSMFFIVNEILFKGHKDSSMAPWWIIKRTK